MFIKMYLLILISFGAAMTDLKTKKIPNFIFVFGMASALLFDLLIFPIPVKKILIKGFCIALIFCFGMFRLLGIGDIKLWMILAAYLGFLKSCIAVGIGLVLFIIIHTIGNRDNQKIMLRAFLQLATEKRIMVSGENGYPLAPCVFIPTLIIAVLSVFRVV